MKLTRTKQTVESQSVAFTLQDIALQAVHECLNDGDGYVGATRGAITLQSGHSFDFDVVTDQDTGAVSVVFDRDDFGRRDTATVTFTVER